MSTQLTRTLCGNDIVFDSGNNSSVINNAQLSNIPIVLNRDNFSRRMTVAEGTQIPIEGSGRIFNHYCNLIPHVIYISHTLYLGYYISGSSLFYIIFRIELTVNV